MQVRQANRLRQWPVYLQGKTGIGKSFAAALIYRDWGVPNVQSTAMWFSLGELCGVLQAFGTNPIQWFNVQGKSVDMTISRFWDKIAAVDLVVIDEIGTRAVSDHRYDALLRVLELRKGRPLILTGNIEEAAIAKTYDERVLSRIMEGTFINYLGNDRRSVGFEDRFHVVD